MSGHFSSIPGWMLVRTKTLHLFRNSNIFPFSSHFLSRSPTTSYEECQKRLPFTLPFIYWTWLPPARSKVSWISLLVSCFKNNLGWMFIKSLWTLWLSISLSQSSVALDSRWTPMFMWWWFSFVISCDFILLSKSLKTNRRILNTCMGVDTRCLAWRNSTCIGMEICKLCVQILLWRTFIICQNVRMVIKQVYFKRRHDVCFLFNVTQFFPVHKRSFWTIWNLKLHVKQTLWSHQCPLSFVTVWMVKMKVSLLLRFWDLISTKMTFIFFLGGGWSWIQLLY